MALQAVNWRLGQLWFVGALTFFFLLLVVDRCCFCFLVALVRLMLLKHFGGAIYGCKHTFILWACFG